MQIRAIKTELLRPPKDDLLAAIRKALPRLPEKSILVVTSKVVAISQGRAIRISPAVKKDDLIRSEAAWYLPRSAVPHKWIMLTIKENLLIPSAGIDESNGKGHYILWPKHPSAAARRILAWLQKTYRRKAIGVIITDSHTIPMRRGTIGISLAHAGFEPLYDYRGTPDLFGRRLEIQQANIPDALAAAAVAVMGEGKEQTPLALITKVPFLRFGTKKKTGGRKPRSSFVIPEGEDLYTPLLRGAHFRRGGKRPPKASR